MDSHTDKTPVDQEVQSAEIDLDAKAWITEQVEKEVVRFNKWATLSSQELIVDCGVETYQRCWVRCHPYQGKA